MPWVFVIKAFGFVLGYNGSARAVRVYHIKNPCTKEGVVAQRFGTLDTLESISLITHICALGVSDLAWSYWNIAHAFRKRGFCCGTSRADAQIPPLVFRSSQMREAQVPGAPASPQATVTSSTVGFTHNTSVSSWMVCVPPDSVASVEREIMQCPKLRRTADWGQLLPTVRLSEIPAKDIREVFTDPCSSQGWGHMQRCLHPSLVTALCESLSGQDLSPWISNIWF